MSGDKRVLVVGIGNDFRGDDAVGLAVARKMRDSALPGTEVIEATGEGGRLIDAWSEYEAVVLVDAMRSSSVPGAVRRVDAVSEPVPRSLSHRSTHAIGALDAVELAREMGRLPSQAVIYGIEGERFDAGTELSPEVAAAVPRAVELIRREAAEMLRSMEADTRA